MDLIYFAPQKRLGGGWICFKSSPSAPPAPDYVGAAQATAAGNLDAARAASSANKVNQVTPYGTIDYTTNGNDQFGNPIYTMTQKLDPTQQKLLDQQNKTSLGLSGLADQGLGYVNDALAHPVSMDSLPANMVNPGQTGQDALMARFQPQIDQSHKALETQLANQGVTQGSEAYDNAMRTQNQSENDLRMQAALNGINVGQNAQNQQMALQTALQNEPLNILNAVRTGSQVTNPTFGNAAGTQATTSGADLLGATQGQSAYNQGLYNSQVANNNANNSATASGVGTAAMAAIAFY